MMLALAVVEAVVLVSVELDSAVLLAIHQKTAYNVVLNGPMLACMALRRYKNSDVSAKIIIRTMKSIGQIRKKATLNYLRCV